jgi:P-type E1-E2 ATPase
VQGRRVFCGNRALLNELSLALDADTDVRARAEEAQGHTVSFYGWEGKAEGILVWGDRIREDARASIETLKARGLRVVVVSGDSVGTVRQVAETVGADDWFAEVLPEAKQKLIAQFQADGKRVAMVGDGINDGPALAQADSGIAMGSATSLAMKAAHLVLMNSRLGRIAEALDLARLTINVIRQNLFWAFAYNVAGISLAVMGRLNPIFAAGAMVVSSLFVAWNSSRVSRYTPLNSATTRVMSSDCSAPPVKSLRAC